MTFTNRLPAVASMAVVLGEDVITAPERLRDTAAEQPHYRAEPSEKPLEPPKSVSARAHLPALDGVRGLAIALVMACHFSLGAEPSLMLDKVFVYSFSSGWIGVDLFLVLSGFLITTILLDARDRAHYFRNFYIRRTLRIFPLYYAVLIATLVIPVFVWPAAMGSQWFDTISARAAWFWTYTTNIDIAFNGGWRVGGILGHFWSLALEEQFYLVWPAVVWLVPVRRLRQVCVGIILAAVVIRLGLRSVNMDLAAYTLMPARADALAAGAWLAAAVHTGVDLARLQRTAWWILIVSGGAMTMMFMRQHPLFELAADVQIVGYSLLAFGGTALIALALNTRGVETPLGRFIGHPTLRFLGKYSYAIYCVHPLVEYALKRLPIPLTVDTFPAVAGSLLPALIAYSAVAFALSTGLALISWHMLEKHFLRLRERFH
jgi:peptidoglycan/LPS O-acetylase OafA/YrhL